MNKGVWLAPAALLVCVLMASAALASPDRVRFLEGAAAAKLSPAELAEDVKGYLEPGAFDVQALVPPPPALDSAQDKADVARRKLATAKASGERWTRALADDASLYDRFEKEFALPLDRKHLPRLIRLLNRVEADVSAATSDAKARFSRPRPFQRFALARVCGQATPPKPEPAPTKGTSYPSGHAAMSWAAVLVLEEIAPPQAQALLARIVDYGESRIVCGVHFPSDVEAGRLLAAAVVDRLIAVPEFRRDLVCAKTEVGAVAAGEKSEDLPACYEIR